jgi:hypothetical protein
MLHSNPLKTDELQKIITEPMVNDIFVKTLYNAKLECNEEQINIPAGFSKKNKNVTDRIMTILLEKCPLIVNKKYFIERLTVATSSHFFDAIKETYFKNQCLTTDDIDYALTLCLKEPGKEEPGKEEPGKEEPGKAPNSDFIKEIVLMGEPPLEQACKTRNILLYHLKEAIFRAKKQKNPALLEALEDIKHNIFPYEDVKPKLLASQRQALYGNSVDCINKGIAGIKELWADSQATFAKKITLSIIISITCIAKVLLF